MLMVLSGKETITSGTMVDSPETLPMDATESSARGKNFKMIRTTTKSQSLLRRLTKMITELRNPKRFLEGAVEIMKKAKDRQFDTEGRETETAREWPELAQKTLEDRFKKGFPPGPILQRTGRLKKDWSKALSGNIGSLKSNTPYVNTHQFGEWIVPQRKIGEFKQKDREKIMTLLKDILFT
jgi:phage gpG-like protein